ncbi:hypothetical protein LR48_Vigan03g065400 [Vigna angularis]|uniref:DNA-directed RNA polymerase III subunit RPC6 n=1 Tax=Phaseolus angularis TaxID=3914 RepID=A0A0L9U372_PHAAN|nr:uncharacterized protein LOC108327257 isoform X2 [Vigna angularis]XP_052728301.1 uncharacterized protein LOC108327257 isoform X2 [Vigna angularis]XP_052728302.1 uncharacterized protein LOC108327257 isoform X2 [Vigna angularis]XP_052728303.1 uncharacterized protein LOC108327257 isoform X2 [Vigna angularis]XP_052728304.1 uncharacterized protein LOC108327257 isoform X2 [Vigna angularis]XP_052728305.1 uncharacterized protein LOC108327257 isoform X2 [Vigna angularis]KOM37273.1 hypothetical prote
MNILQGKRKRQDRASALSVSMTNEEQVIYNIIRGKEMGIWQGDIKRETNIPDSILKKSIKLLISKTLIKEVVNIQNKSKKVLMAMEFEPSKEITGGEWYTEGRLDTQLIDALSDVCLKLISRKKIATRDAILEWTRTLGSEVFPRGVSSGQVEQILKVLVMENKLLEVNSTGFGDFSSVPVGEVCFRLAKKEEFSTRLSQVRSEHESAPTPDDASNAEDDIRRTQCWVKIVGGKKKGRLYGAGQLAANYTTSRGGTLKHQPSSSTTAPDEVVLRLTQALKQRDQEITDLRAEFTNFKALVMRVLPEISQDEFNIPLTQPRSSLSPTAPH